MEVTSRITGPHLYSLATNLPQLHGVISTGRCQHRVIATRRRQQASVRAEGDRPHTVGVPGFNYQLRLLRVSRRQSAAQMKRRVRVLSRYSVLRCILLVAGFSYPSAQVLRISPSARSRCSIHAKLTPKKRGENFGALARGVSVDATHRTWGS